MCDFDRQASHSHARYSLKSYESISGSILRSKKIEFRILQACYLAVAYNKSDCDGTIRTSISYFAEASRPAERRM